MSERDILRSMGENATESKRQTERQMNEEKNRREKEKQEYKKVIEAGIDDYIPFSAKTEQEAKEVYDKRVALINAIAEDAIYTLDQEHRFSFGSYEDKTKVLTLKDKKIAEIKQDFDEDIAYILEQRDDGRDQKRVKFMAELEKRLRGV